MKEVLGKLLLLVVSLIVVYGLGEIVLRQVGPLLPPKYEDTVRRLLDQPERLFVANQTAIYESRNCMKAPTQSASG